MALKLTFYGIFIHHFQIVDQVDYFAFALLLCDYLQNCDRYHI